MDSKRVGSICLFVLVILFIWYVTQPSDRSQGTLVTSLDVTSTKHPLQHNELSGNSGLDNMISPEIEDTLEDNHFGLYDSEVITEDTRTSVDSFKNDRARNDVIEPIESDHGVDSDDSLPVISNDNLKQVSLIGAADSGDWDAFLDIAFELELISDYELATSFSEAIRNNAPLWVFEDLINRGAHFNVSHLLMLASNNQLSLIKQLIPLGLDIHMVNTEGMNAVHAAIMPFSDTEVFNFLMEEKVRIDTKVAGLDPLARALTGMLGDLNSIISDRKVLFRHNKALYYARLLISAKANVTPDHFTIVNQMKETNPKSYQHIINYLPPIMD